MGILLGSLLLLALATGVGHRIWVGLAARFRSLAGEPAPRPEPAGERRPVRCPGCNATLTGRQQDCPSCGLEADGPVAQELRELEAAARQVRALEARGEAER